VDAGDLCRLVHERYLRYLTTTFHFRDPELRAAFEAELRRSRLAQGPFLEATPVFEPGGTLAELAPDVEEGVLAALRGSRRLYWHQEQALRAVRAGRNVVVTTGTGSGKTEAFLYPILLHLYGEYAAGTLGPGVRALVLYPMNALVNDQRERLGEIAAALERAGAGFRFTFGQYVGVTPEDERDTAREARERLRQRLPGELVLRAEMRQTPPHILLTNYSMLEYLLLRPQDSPLFEGPWSFLVLDEAHQYRGARGVEMAMLLRRLKERLRSGGVRGPLRCIATSATIAGEGQAAEVARFAADLFGEPFAPGDVIESRTIPSPPPSAAELPPAAYARLEAVLEGRQPPASLTPWLGGAEAPGSPAAAVGAVLARDGRAQRLRQALAAGPCRTAELARVLWPELPEPEREGALDRLVHLLVRAQEPASGSPLLAVRYHFLLRSLEGAFLTRAQPPAGDWRLVLSREGEKGRPCFELALCRECGQHYLVGSVRGGRLAEAVRDVGAEDFGAVFFRPLEPGAMDQGVEGELWALCPVCAALGRPRGGVPDPGCGHGPGILLERQKGSAAHEDQLSRCTACGYQAADPVQEVLHGADGPHTVIVSTLVRHLPPGRNKVLAFADSRQDAAFFAWYLQRSHDQVENRSLLWQALGRAGAGAEGLSPRELAWAVEELLGEHGMLGPAAGLRERRREAWRRVLREMLTRERRLSLEGVGLVRWEPLPRPVEEVAGSLDGGRWGLSPADLADLVRELLQRARAEGAVELPEDAAGLLRWADLELGPGGGHPPALCLGSAKARPGLISWDGPRGTRAHLVAKLLRARGLPEPAIPQAAQELLSRVWDALGDQAEALEGGLGLLVRRGDARRLHPDWWRVAPLGPADALQICDTCGHLAVRSLGGLCPRPACPGRCRPATAGELEHHHYREVYREDPLRLRVEEHTAQIARERAEALQRDFKAGRIQVLSCSTTFELGVDLGDLDTVFLRNVPPEAFHYAQRVGRAGRRGGQPGLAIAYCRRSPHDLYHFERPERMIRGQVSPPVLQLRNPKILLRHVTATALADFFRARPQRFGTVADFCADIARPEGRSAFRQHLLAEATRLAATLRRIVPEAAWSGLGLDDGDWVEQVAGPDSRLAQAEAELAGDARHLADLEERARQQGAYDQAKWARTRRQTLGQEDILSFLSRKAVIPKYGFPVDVVELDTSTSRSAPGASPVALQRDLTLAIGEFAPGSRLVADKGEWLSAALKRVVEREWPWRDYWRCDVHNRLGTAEHGLDPGRPCCERARRGSYIIPAFGFRVDPRSPQEPSRRPRRLLVTRPYFLHWARTPQPAHRYPALEVTAACPGTLVVLCEGRGGEGFWICTRCGAARQRLSQGGSHETPFGEPCPGPLRHVTALGHEFVTDATRLQFLLPPGEAATPSSLAYSLAFALLEGLAAVLEVPTSDLGTTVAWGEGPVSAIVLYDAVPGGAGLVARLGERAVLRGCLEAALERVRGECGCGEDGSCYGCLRSYRNQFVHAELRRGPARRYLEAVLAGLGG
jgi:hypothetical protein